MLQRAFSAFSAFLAFIVVIGRGIAIQSPLAAAPIAPTAVQITAPAPAGVVTTPTTPFTGTSTPGSTLTIVIDGGAPVAVTANAAGTWSYTIAIGNGPHAATITAVERERLLWGNARLSPPSAASRGAVIAVDLKTNTLVTTIPGYNSQEGIAVHRASGRVYVCNDGASGDGEISVINGYTDTVITNVPSVRCALMTMNPAGDKLYVARLDGDIQVYDVTSPIPVLVDTILVVNNTSSALHRLLFDPANADRLLVGGYGVDRVYVVDVITRTVVASYATGAVPRRITATTNRIYTANAVDSSVSVIDRTSGNSMNTTATQGVPEDIAVSPDGSRAFIVIPGGGRLNILTTATNALSTVFLDGHTQATKGGVLFAQTRNAAYLAGIAELMVLDASTGSPTAFVPIGSNLHMYDMALMDTQATATVNFSVNATADLTIVKSALNAPWTVGEQGQYTLSVQNLGPAPAQPMITVSDTLPVGTTFVSATGTGWACGASGQTVTCTRATALASGTSAPLITLTVNVGAAAAPSVTNTATVTSATPESSSGNNTSTVTTPVLVPQLAIQKSATPPNGTAVAAFDSITYTLRVQNTGTLPLTNVRITDTIPLSTNYVAGSAQPTPISSAPLVWMISTLAVGESATVSFAVQVQPIGTTVMIVNTGYAASNQTPPIESNEVIHPFDPTAVEITRFSARWGAADTIVVDWETAFEMDTAGWALYGGTTPDWEQASSETPQLIAPLGTANSGAQYQTTLTEHAGFRRPGPVYIWLEERQTDGSRHHYGPVKLPTVTIFLPFFQRSFFTHRGASLWVPLVMTEMSQYGVLSSHCQRLFPP